ncbi:MAG: bifunctional demethylmenaquinone methyltransferase/2-methoxy-6-polyprenyl-1,4-benzoquinol methylase UbiE [Pseudomonadales bacterium]|nr:bifunctional demethylmenaquinone methyltransferase/2-methoxy-6-polyprenyl-1,4-benzoquinol methylase UbiE [Pseudomonadales bacterium]
MQAQTMSEETTHFGRRQVPVAEKASHVAQVFHSVANKYDMMNDLMSLGSHRLMKRFAVELTAVRPGHQVMDLAGGTGDLTELLSRKVGLTGEVILTDINYSMLSAGRTRLLDRGYAGNIRYLQADAEHLPLPDNTLNCVTMAFGLRNVTRKEQALKDILRVLKPGGKLVVLEFSHPVNPVFNTAYKAFSSLWPAVGKAITGDRDSYQYLVESIEMHPDQETLRELFSDAGFQSAQYHNLINGVAAIHTGVKPG